MIGLVRGSTNGPTFDRTILQYVQYLFGFNRDTGPHGETNFSPVDSVSWMYSGRRPEAPNAYGLSAFDDVVVSEGEAAEFIDVVSIFAETGTMVSRCSCRR